MSHRIGRMVPKGARIGPDSGLPASTPGVWTFDLAVEPALIGGSACFVMLHFTGAVFGPGAVVKVDLGYDVDLFPAASGAEFWTRPLDPVKFAQSVRVITFSGTIGRSDPARVRQRRADGFQRVPLQSGRVRG
jgi:hypothetical protein